MTDNALASNDQRPLANYINYRFGFRSPRKDGTMARALRNAAKVKRVRK